MRIGERDALSCVGLVAQRCLYGVDLNPMAVQLARLSLWLTTLASDRPLTFLDHHLATGDSLIGAGFRDLARNPSGSIGAAKRPSQIAALPLFADRRRRTVGTTASCPNGSGSRVEPG